MAEERTSVLMRFAPEMLAAIENFAASEGVTRHAAIIRLIEQRFAIGPDIAATLRQRDADLEACRATIERVRDVLSQTQEAPVK